LLSGLLLLAAATLPAPVRAQAPAAQAAPVVAVPDQLTLAKLVWSTMAAVDHANKTGNYFVLRDLGSPGFQSSNTALTLAGVFSRLRGQRLDLADTFLVEPLFDFPPRMEGGLLRMRGAFRLRPTGIQFDLLYQWNGTWQLHGIAINPVPMGR
jgi:hypothetical protein